MHTTTVYMKAVDDALSTDELVYSTEIRLTPWSRNEHNGSNGMATSKRNIHSWPGAYVLSLECSLTMWAVILLWCQRASDEGVEGKRKNVQK